MELEILYSGSSPSNRRVVANSNNQEDDSILYVIDVEYLSESSIALYITAQIASPHGVELRMSNVKSSFIINYPAIGLAVGDKKQLTDFFMNSEIKPKICFCFYLTWGHLMEHFLADYPDTEDHLAIPDFLMFLNDYQEMLSSLSLGSI